MFTWNYAPLLSVGFTSLELQSGVHDLLGLVAMVYPNAAPLHRLHGHCKGIGGAGRERPRWIRPRAWSSQPCCHDGLAAKLRIQAIKTYRDILSRPGGGDSASITIHITHLELN